jgi:molybdate transport system substrate-binding protein
VSGAAVVLAAVVCVSGGSARAQVDPLRVFSSNGVKAGLERLQSQSERIVGRPLAITLGTSAAIRQRVADGQRFDVAILTADAIDDLRKAGAIAGAVAPMGRSGIGIGVRAGTMKMDVSTADALKHILLAVRALTYASDGASRPSIARMLDTFGIGDAMAPKTILEQGSVRATARVVQGDADMVITLVSEIVPIPGLELAGPLPEEFQTYVSFAAGVSATTPHVDAARALVAYLSGPDARPAFAATGLDAPR